MKMKNKGWVKLWRNQYNNWISEGKPWCDGYAWTFLYSQANHKKGMVNFRNEYIEVKRGQLLTSKLKLQGIFGWTRWHVVNLLKALKNAEMITYRTTNRYIVITIVNYEKYQGSDEQNNKQNNIQTTYRRQTDDKRPTINKNVLKNVKNGKKVLSIYNFWNLQDIVTHKSIDPFMSCIKIALNKYSEEAIKTAIKNYSYIIKSDDYFYNFRFTLIKFLTITAKNNHIEEFSDLEIAKNNYMKGDYNGKNRQNIRRSTKPGEDKYKHLEETY